MFDIGSLPTGVLWWPMYAAAAWVLLVNFFSSTMHAKQMIRRGDRPAPAFLIPILIGAAIGYVEDVLLNVVVGSIIFWELPQEWMFSDRVQRHVDESVGKYHSRAVWWGRELNKFDAGHITGV